MKNIYLILLLVLVALAVYFTYENNRVVGDNDFVLEDTSIINKIIIKKDDLQVKIVKNKDEWIVNNRYKANNTVLKRFFRVFSNITLIAPVSKLRKDSITDELNKKGTIIVLYAGSSIVNKYILGSLNKNKSGNYLLCNNRLGLVNSPGLITDINKIISVEDIFWRNKIIFNKQAEQIKYVSVINVQEIDKSFTISISEKKINLLNSKNMPVANFNPDKVKLYLSFFQNIGFKQIETDLTKAQKDSVMSNNHAWSIALKDNNDIEYRLDLFFKPAKITNQLLSKTYDLNLIYGKLHKEKKMLIFEYYSIDPILKNINYFIEP